MACCFLSDWQVKGKEQINEKLAEYGDGWNSLKNKSINEILAHWFDKILGESWNPEHSNICPDALEHVHITKHIIMNYMMIRKLQHERI